MPCGSCCWTLVATMNTLRCIHANMRSAQCLLAGLMDTESADEVVAERLHRYPWISTSFGILRRGLWPCMLIFAVLAVYKSGDWSQSNSRSVTQHVILSLKRMSSFTCKASKVILYLQSFKSNSIHRSTKEECSRRNKFVVKLRIASSLIITFSVFATGFHKSIIIN
jgi:hypothetical protein